MKILYAVQATGNGHISRAMELLPYLQQQGTVDIFLSGNNSMLPMDAPVKFRSKGLSLYYKKNGGLDYLKILTRLQPIHLKKEICNLPVEKYDLILNDFEFITAAACKQKNVPSINFGHQASFHSSNTPRPEKKNKMGEFVLKNYAVANRYVGFHFKEYDSFIFPPVIKKEILNASPQNKNHTTVYLASFGEKQLKEIFKKIPEVRFDIFCKDILQPKRENHLNFLPVNTSLFNQSLINCAGIITSAGFETPAEALYLRKALLCIPIRGQYEQHCNAAALTKMGVTCLPDISDNFKHQFYKWAHASKIVEVNYGNTIPNCIDHLFSL